MHRGGPVRKGRPSVSSVTITHIRVGLFFGLTPLSDARGRGTAEMGEKSRFLRVSFCC